MHITSDYPYLSLKNITIDSDLARRLPRQLAYYHLAIPLAQDGDQISVVMAYPDNHAVRDMLEIILHAEIVPVVGAAVEIKNALDRVWNQASTTIAPRLLCWGESIQSAATLFAESFSAQITYTDSAQTDLDAVLTLAREGQYRLIVAPMLESPALAYLLKHAPTPVLLTHGLVPRLERILLALRGHSPDDSALDWAIPLAIVNQASVTLMAIPPTTERLSVAEGRHRHSLAVLVDAESGPGAHIALCSHRLVESGIKGTLRLCQGQPEQQIALEFTQQAYSLLIIAAETDGNFVQHVLAQIHSQAPNSQQSVLIVKPISD